MENDTATHSNPVWGDRANFLIKARLAQIIDEKTATSTKWEQLWCKQVSANQFEICCIPFFVYDLCLADVVETGLEGESRYVLQKVIRPSNHYCFRVWFGGSSKQQSREDVAAFISRLGCLLEWSSTHLLAIDASSDNQAQALATYLIQQEEKGSLVYETGRNS